MAVNSDIQAKSNESTASVMRRFSRHARSSGVVRKAKSLRYRSRELSSNMKKKQALRSIKKQNAAEKLIKLGKLKDNKRHYALTTLSNDKK